MRQLIALTGLLAIISVVFVSYATEAGSTGTGFLSPLDLASDPQGSTLYVLEATAHRVALFDIKGRKVTKAIALPAEPTGMALTPDGSLLYVTTAGDPGGIYSVDPQTGDVALVLSAGHTPVAPVISPDGKMLCVCNRFDDDVAVFDLAAKKQIARIPVTREPVAATVTPDGRLLFVANHIPAGASDGDYAAAVVSVVDLPAKKVVETIALPNGSTALRGLCLSPDGRYAYLAHILARYQLPTTQLERGWMNTNALSIIDVNARKLTNTVLLDDVDLGAANPWAVACTKDGKYVCVTHAGTHELSVIDRAKLHDKLDRVAAGQKVSDVSQSPEDVPNDLSFLVGLRRRLKLKGNGPRGLALIGARAYAAEYFTDSLALIDIDPNVRPKAESLPLGPARPLTTVRKGEMLFHDASLCFQHWQSCASCHPGGARADSLNWDLLNDGIGNPKNTKSLLLAHKTPPAMATAARPTGEAAVRAGIRYIQFAVRPEEDAAAIDEYLKSLKPLPSPRLIEGKLSASALRGQKLFDTAGCGACHAPPLYTDLRQHDLGTARGLDEGLKFD
ncbi:MAG: beta-propeller fold lactonase family protein, partial [Phycisphaerales bacterium]